MPAIWNLILEMQLQQIHAVIQSGRADHKVTMNDTPNALVAGNGQTGVDDASIKVQIVESSAVAIPGAVLVTSDGGGFNASNRFVNIGQPNINLFGSLAQFRRGIVGRSNGDGFLKNYKFDPRVTFDAPPNFPCSACTYSDWLQSAL